MSTVPLRETRHPGWDGVPEETYFVGEAIGLVYESRELAFEVRGLGPCPFHGLSHLGVAASEVAQKSGCEASFALRAALSHLIDEDVGADCGKIFELPVLFLRPPG